MREGNLALGNEAEYSGATAAELHGTSPLPLPADVQISLRGVERSVNRRWNQVTAPTGQILLRGKRKISLAQAGQLAGRTEEAREMRVGTQAPREPGIAENIGASLTGGDHIGHLRFLFG